MVLGSIKQQFPFFGHHPEMVYLDNAASTHKPGIVIDRVQAFLSTDYATILRGSYPLAMQAESARWEAKKNVATLLNVHESEIIFTNNSTGSVNLLTTSLGRSHWLKKGDIIVLSIAEHHANIVPRQILAEQTGAEVVYLGLTDERQYDLAVLETIDLQRVKIVSLSQVSNVTGVIMDLSEISEKAKKYGRLFVVDGSQAVGHLLPDLPTLGADFYYFTGHKIGALTGIGVLRGRAELLKKLQPGIGGGGAIEAVDLKGHTYQPAPDKYEPGTPNVVGAISLGETIGWIASLGGDTGTLRERLIRAYEAIGNKEADLMTVCMDHLRKLQKTYGIELLGPRETTHRIGIFSLVLPEHYSLSALGRSLGEQQICIRTGSHCTHPLHAEYGSHPTARMSLWLYNDIGDIQKFFGAVERYLGEKKSTT